MILVDDFVVELICRRIELTLRNLLLRGRGAAPEQLGYGLARSFIELHLQAILVSGHKLQSSGYLRGCAVCPRINDLFAVNPQADPVVANDMKGIWFAE